MKTQLQLRTSLATAVLLSCLLVPALNTGCVTPGNDPVVVQAERTTQLALDVFDTFLLWEHNNRQALLDLDPKIKVAADFIRERGQTWLETSRAMTKAYKENRSDANKANLDTALAVLRAGVGEAQKYFVKGVQR